MASILVDYENVFASYGLRGVETLKEDDTLIIFYSDTCRKIRQDYMQAVVDSGCEFRIVKLEKTGKNALDFYIAVECGILSCQGKNQLAIISNDKGFQAVLDYFNVSDLMTNIHIVKAGNIESALLLLDSPENADRRAEIKKKSIMLDLAAEQARIEERSILRNKIKNAILGTEYENKIPKIMNLLEENCTKGMRNLYTESLHCFGRHAGTQIYRLVKPLVG
ncbi:MAG: PIN domain-containing protein [Lachnospiraceae bacterium]|nr:PIN domain-containing protein [Lachnospiraceae bacterium]